VGTLRTLNKKLARSGQLALGVWIGYNPFHEYEGKSYCSH